MAVIDLANPSRFLALSDRVRPWLVAATLVAFAIGLWFAFAAPGDYQQGETVRIMYVHVPSAWLGMALYAAMTASALGILVWKHPLADVAARGIAPVGALFTFFALVTGSLWGKPMWGTWWQWDARLTSMLVLLIMYLGLMALWHAFEDPIRAGKVGAVLVLVGAVDLPIIKFSVDWWSTLHQPASVIRIGGPTIHPAILVPLLVMAIAFTLLAALMVLATMRNEILARRLHSLGLRAADAARS